MVIDEMVRTLSQYPNGTFLRLSWDCESFVIDGILDTIYETDNGADEGSKEYQEFYACAIQIKHIIKSSENRTLALNSLIEISILFCQSLSFTRIFMGSHRDFYK